MQKSDSKDRITCQNRFKIKTNNNKYVLNSLTSPRSVEETVYRIKTEKKRGKKQVLTI